MSLRSVKSSFKSLPTDVRQATFERQKSVMEMYSDNAKTYIQLSGAALALTVTFVREILRIPSERGFADGWLIAMWACFLLAIVSGAFYQYLAAKYVESCIDWEHSSAWDWLSAGTIYGVMLFAFYGGTILFTIYAIVTLRR